MASSSAGQPHALHTLLQALAQGTSPSSSDLTASEAALSSYEAQFHSQPSPESRPWVAYAEIALTPPGQSLPLPASINAVAVRTLAIIRLKHAIDKYWRAGRVVQRSNRAGDGAKLPAPVRIVDEDKASLRKLLLERVLTEENRAIALQASVCISKIARTDFPAQWPDLFDQSFQALNQTASNVIGGGRGDHATLERDALVMLRAAEVSKRSIKELSQVRVLAGKVRMAEVSSSGTELRRLRPAYTDIDDCFSSPLQLAKQILPSLLSFYPQLFDATFPASSSLEAVHGWIHSRSASVTATLVRVCHLLFKMMSTLAIADIGTLSARTADQSQSNLSLTWFNNSPRFLDHVFGVRLSFLEVQSSSRDPAVASQLASLGQNLTKHLSAFGKLYLGLLDKDKSQATSWNGWSDVVGWYWTKTGQAPASAKEKSRDIDEEALMPYPSTLVVHTLLLLRRSLEAWNSPVSRGRPIPEPFGTDEFAVATADIVVDYFLPFERSALERWELDPEQWTVEEDQAQEDYASEVRPCAERLLLVLAQHCRHKRVGRKIWNKFLESASYDTQDIGQVVRRDAVYTALGRMRDFLPLTETEDDDEENAKGRDDRIDISRAFVERLLPEAAQLPPQVSPSWVLIRRRVSWLLYEYSEQLSPSSRDKVYRLLTMLLDASNDLGGDIAVRLSAARTLGALTDDMGFDADVFQPYLESAIKSLAELATSDELALMDSIALSTRSLSLLIERSGPRVGPLVLTLTDLAPALWAKETSEECKTRPSVLMFVKSLLRATESTSAADPALSARLQSLVAPLVTSCLQRGLAPLLGLDALQLWHKAVRCAAAMQGDIFNLLSTALDIDGANGGQGPFTEIPDYASDFGRVVEEYALWFQPSGGAGPGGVARELVRVYGPPLFRSWARVLNDDAMTLFVLQSIDVLAQSISAGDRYEASGNVTNDGAAGLYRTPSTYAGTTIFAQALNDSGLFETIVRGAILLKVRLSFAHLRHVCSPRLAPTEITDNKICSTLRAFLHRNRPSPAVTTSRFSRGCRSVYRLTPLCLSCAPASLPSKLTPRTR